MERSGVNRPSAQMDVTVYWYGGDSTTWEGIRSYHLSNAGAGTFKITLRNKRLSGVLNDTKSKDVHEVIFIPLGKVKKIEVKRTIYYYNA